MNIICKFVPHICKYMPPGYADLSPKPRPLGTNIRVYVHTHIFCLPRLRFCRMSGLPTRDPSAHPSETAEDSSGACKTQRLKAVTGI